MEEDGYKTWQTSKGAAMYVHIDAVVFEAKAWHSREQQQFYFRNMEPHNSTDYVELRICSSSYCSSHTNTDKLLSSFQITCNIMSYM